MSKLSRRFVAAALVVLSGSLSSADELPAQFKSMFENCDRGSAMDSYMCLTKVLAELDRMLDQSIGKAGARINSMWGEAAGAEIRKRLTKSQASWRTYRQEYRVAVSGYYTAAQMHPPSQQQQIPGLPGAQDG